MIKVCVTGAIVLAVIAALTTLLVQYGGHWFPNVNLPKTPSGRTKRDLLQEPFTTRSRLRKSLLPSAHRVLSLQHKPILLKRDDLQNTLNPGFTAISVNSPYVNLDSIKVNLSVVPAGISSGHVLLSFPHQRGGLYQVDLRERLRYVMKCTPKLLKDELVAQVGIIQCHLLRKRLRNLTVTDVVSMT